MHVPMSIYLHIGLGDRKDSYIFAKPVDPGKRARAHTHTHNVGAPSNDSTICTTRRQWS